MKMSDVFELPVKPSAFGTYYPLLKDAAAAHAVNCHDDLVAALEGILGGACPDCKGWGEVAYFGELVSCKCGGNLKYTHTERQISSAKAALAKARGEG